MRNVLASIVPTLLAVALSMAWACSPPQAGGAIELDADDAGHRIELSRDRTLYISLASNPTTGYRWEVDALDEDVLRQVGEPEFEPQSRLVGAPGVEILHFQAVNTGRTTVKLVYRRSWEKDVEPLETYSVDVVVR
jgi:inhibitor of cysteine peptidase